jgi:hypothetical protein
MKAVTSRDGTRVEQAAELPDLAGGDVIERHSGNLQISAGGRGALIFSLMRACARPALGEGFLFAHHLFEGGMPVGKRAAVGACEYLQTLAVACPTPGSVMMACSESNSSATAIFPPFQNSSTKRCASALFSSTDIFNSPCLSQPSPRVKWVAMRQM